MYHYVRMHGWTGACKRHVSVYDSAYVHIFRFSNATKRSASQKVTFCCNDSQGICEISRSLILLINVISIAVMIRIIIGIIITYTDTTYKHVNNKIKSNRHGCILSILDFSFQLSLF